MKSLLMNLLGVAPNDIFSDAREKRIGCKLKEWDHLWFTLERRFGKREKERESELLA